MMVLAEAMGIQEGNTSNRQEDVQESYNVTVSR